MRPRETSSSGEYRVANEPMMDEIQSPLALIAELIGHDELAHLWSIDESMKPSGDWG